MKYLPRESVVEPKVVPSRKTFAPMSGTSFPKTVPETEPSSLLANM